MAPFEIRDACLKQLRAVRNGFFKSEAAAALDKMTEKEKEAAGRTLVHVNIAIRKLENVQLAQIADQLKSLENDLVSAVGKLEKALNNLRKFKQVLDSASGVLKLLAKVATLAGVPIPA